MWLLEFTVRVMMVVSLALMALLFGAGHVVVWILSNLFSGGRGKGYLFILVLPSSFRPFFTLQDYINGSRN